MRRTHTHTRNSDGGAAIEYLSVSSVFWVYPSVLVLFGRSCCLKNCDCYRHDFFSGATAGVRCAMVCRCGRGWCPGRHSLRFTIHRISRGRRQISNSRRIASGALTQCEHPTSQVRSTPQFQFNPIQKKSFWTSLSIDFESNFHRPTMEMPFWLFIFRPIRFKFTSIQFKKSHWIHCFSFVKTGPQGMSKTESKSKIVDRNENKQGADDWCPAQTCCPSFFRFRKSARSTTELTFFNFLIKN